MRRSKLAAIAALAAVSVAAVPGGGTANAALGPCRVLQTDVSVVSGWQYVAIAGAHTAPVGAGAIGVDLTCGAVVNGITYATVSDDVPGPVAALAGPGTVRRGEVRSCYELRVHYLDGSSTYSDTCP